MKKISLITACYNESANIQHVYDRVTTTMQQLKAYDFELIFVDNASTDNSVELYHKLTLYDTRAHVLFIARNTGNSQLFSYWRPVAWVVCRHTNTNN